MKKSSISYILRKMGLMYPADKFRFYLEKRRNKKQNEDFRREYPDVKLPSDYLMYESYRMDYRKYYLDGKDTAKWVYSYFEKHLPAGPMKILDWGCGPARVVRHLPEILPAGSQSYGTDYNKDSIAWCTKNLPEIQFNLNGLEASLPYEDNFFDGIYGISIFTHLSEKLHFDWFNELYRVLKPGGVLLLTTHGEYSRLRLSDAEKQIFDEGRLVVRGQVKEGHRTFVAYQSKAFMQKMIGAAVVLEHVVTPPKEGVSWIPQDLWVLTKK